MTFVADTHALVWHLMDERDPMDRLILAAARAVGAQLVSADEALDGQGVERVWG